VGSYVQQEWDIVGEGCRKRAIFVANQIDTVGRKSKGRCTRSRIAIALQRGRCTTHKERQFQGSTERQGKPSRAGFYAEGIMSECFHQP
jgi:hypothetical protein